jgi:hypothetical protein
VPLATELTHVRLLHQQLRYTYAGHRPGRGLARRSGSGPDRRHPRGQLQRDGIRCLRPGVVQRTDPRRLPR